MAQPESLYTGVAHRIGRYADAVRVPAGTDTIYLSGTPGLDADGNVPADFAEEARQAWRNVEAALAQGGAALTDIVHVRQWLTSAADLPAYVAVRKEFIQHEPAFMLAVVGQLVWPNLRVEIEVTAVRPAG
jgi:enamine deaminase RidA (YjgF/YER057c/UK114 family)